MSSAKWRPFCLEPNHHCVKPSADTMLTIKLDTIFHSLCQCQMRFRWSADTFFFSKWPLRSRKISRVLESWWRHQMNTFSALLALCAGNLPVTGEFHSPRPVTRSCNVFSYLRLNKRMSKQSRRRWFETPSRLLWRHCNVFTGPVHRQHYCKDPLVVNHIGYRIVVYRIVDNCTILGVPLEGQWYMVYHYFFYHNALSMKHFF